MVKLIISPKFVAASPTTVQNLLAQENHQKANTVPDWWTSKIPLVVKLQLYVVLIVTTVKSIMFNISTQETQTAKPTFQVRIMETPVHIMADSGSTVNILSKRDFDSLKPKPQLTGTNAKVYPYISAKLLDLCGKF